MKHLRQYIVASNENEAVDLRRSLGQKALFIAGGTTVVPRASANVEVLIDINHLGLEGVSVSESVISIGATTRLCDLCTHDVTAAVPLLSDSVKQCATPLIRNLATIGGCIETSFLPSDVAAALLALGAKVEILQVKVMEIPIEKIFLGEMEQPYLIRRIILPRQSGGHGFMKLGRSNVDIGLVNVAAVVDLDDGRIRDLSISVGQTSTSPVLVKEICESSRGKRLTQDLIGTIADSVSKSITPRSDFRASGWYRRQAIATLVARCLVKAGRISNES
ncbi:MAG: FAD binding domain-containing protein [bacterium]